MVKPRRTFLNFLIIFFCTAQIVGACTWDGTCTSDCPAPPDIGIKNRPWCAISEYGTVGVSSNISSSWTVSGPSSFSGGGKNQSQGSIPVGAYTISWGAVGGYVTPASQSITLSNQGDVITFSGNYVVVAPSVDIYFSLLDTLFFTLKYIVF